MTTEQDAQYASFAQRHPYLEAFVEGIPWKMFPVYLGLSLVMAWLGYITIFMMSEHGGTEANVQQLATLARVSGVLFFVLPYVYGGVSVLNRWLEYRRGAA